MKSKIIDIATKQMLAGGYDNLSFGRIAEELNITRANIHYHFKNKENLALEVFMDYETKIVDHYNSMRIKYKNDLIGFCRTVEEYFWEKNKKNKRRGRVAVIEIISDASFPIEIANKCRKLYEKIRKILYGVIEDAIESKQIKKTTDIDREATKLFVMMIGMFTSASFYQTSNKAKNRMDGFIVDWANSIKKK
jgi:TetR/AcrR family transcriptional repressor of nem operon